jgi:hypothetical protein
MTLQAGKELSSVRRVQDFSIDAANAAASHAVGSGARGQVAGENSPERKTLTMSAPAAAVPRHIHTCRRAWPP